MNSYDSNYFYSTSSSRNQIMNGSGRINNFFTENGSPPLRLPEASFSDPIPMDEPKSIDRCLTEKILNILSESKEEQTKKLSYEANRRDFCMAFKVRPEDCDPQEVAKWAQERTKETLKECKQFESRGEGPSQMLPPTAAQVQAVRHQSRALGIQGMSDQSIVSYARREDVPSLPVFPSQNLHQQPPMRGRGAPHVRGGGGGGRGGAYHAPLLPQRQYDGMTLLPGYRDRSIHVFPPQDLHQQPPIRGRGAPAVRGGGRGAAPPLPDGCKTQ